MESAVKFVDKVVGKIEKWFTAFPHLPASGRKWLGENIWWLVAVAAVFSTIGSLVQINRLFSVISITSGSSPWAYYYIGYTWWSVIVALIAVVLFVVTTLVLWLAVKPLQNKTKRGWTILFLALLLELVAVVVPYVLEFSLYSIIGVVTAIIGIGIGAYFMFEMRSQFAVPKRKK